MDGNKDSSETQNQRPETSCDTDPSACQVSSNLKREFDLFPWVIWPLFWLRVGVLWLVIYQNHGNRNEVTLPKEDTLGRQKGTNIKPCFKKLICKKYLYIKEINNFLGILIAACQLFYSLH